MKRLKQQSRQLPPMWAILIFCLLARIQGAPPSTPGTNAVSTVTATRPGIPQSVFIIPTNPQQGRDPFYPYSSRPPGSSSAPNPAAATNLVLKGFSGTPGHRLAIINGQTFEQGEEAEVITTMGRILVRCVEIKAESVTVEVGGQRNVLHLAESPSRDLK
jgi:hypothetical protein